VIPADSSKFSSKVECKMEEDVAMFSGAAIMERRECGKF